AIVEDRREGDAAVLGLPEAAEGGGDVPDARVLRVDVDVLHAAAGEAGADAAKFDALQRLFVEAILLLAGWQRDGGHRHGDDQQGGLTFPSGPPMNGWLGEEGLYRPDRAAVSTDGHEGADARAVGLPRAVRADVSRAAADRPVEAQDAARRLPL